MGKSSKTKILALRLSNETMANLEAEAHLRGANVSDLGRMAIDEWLQRQVLTTKARTAP